MANSVTDPPSTPGDRTYTTLGSNESTSSSADQQQQQSSSGDNKKSGVRFAEMVADNANDFTKTAADNLATGVNQLVGWTYENTKVESRGLRPMHVRVSVRVHHVSFLHPGLDSGSRATISDTKKGKLRFGKKHKKPTGPPGLLKFGKKSGSWKNPAGPDNMKQQLKEAAKDVGPWNRSQKDTSTDPADVAEIVNAEAFRLSRDGLIQQHYALTHALPKSPSEAKKQRRKSPTRFSPTRRDTTPNTPESVQSNPYASMLSPESLADPEGAARYYKECAARPKGYRRLVVSSLPQRNDESLPQYQADRLSPTDSTFKLPTQL